MIEGCSSSQACPVCRGLAFRLLGKPRWGYGEDWNRFTYHQCCNCGVLALFPVLSPAEYERLYGVGRADPQGVEEHKQRIAKELSLTERQSSLSSLPMMRFEFDDYLFCRRPGKVLDVGCGDGTLLTRFARRGWEVYGVDHYPAAIAALNAVFGARFQERSATSFHFNERFDLIVMSQTFEHVPNPVEVLRYLRGYLDESGELVITTPNADSLARRLFRLRWFYYGAPEHVLLYGRRSMERVLTEAGYGVRRFRSFGAPSEYATSRKGWTKEGAYPQISALEKVFWTPLALLANMLAMGSDIMVVAAVEAIATPAQAEP